MYHTLDGVPYWDETASYEFTAAEVDQIEEATNTLHQMCLELVQDVIDKKQFDLFEIRRGQADLICRSWDENEPTIYGRFDFAFDGSGPPKLLEYNADTPTSLLEAAVIQWYWLKDIYPDADQFNSLHEKLIAKWKDIANYLSKPVYFASADYPEDLLTIAYLRDTAEQAGLKAARPLVRMTRGPRLGEDVGRLWASFGPELG